MFWKVRRAFGNRYNLIIQSYYQSFPCSFIWSNRMTTSLQQKTQEIYRKFRRREVCLYLMTNANLNTYLEGLKLYYPQLTRHIANVESIIAQDRLSNPNSLLHSIIKSQQKKEGFTSKLKKWIFEPFSKSQKENQYTVQQQKGYSSLPTQELACIKGPRALLNDQ